MKDVDCRVFEDQLDALMAGTLPEEGMGQLQLHAQSCPDCSMLLRVKEHLSVPSLEELEGAVPEELLGSILPRVERELEGSSAYRHSWRAWLVPTLAAASAALLFSTGFLYSELQRVKATGFQLAEEVGTLRTEMTALEMRTEEVERTAALAGRASYQARALDFLITGPESPTLGDLIDLLESYSDDEVLLEASQVRNLRRLPPLIPREAREIGDILDILYREVRDRGTSQDIRAGELADWLANSGIPRDRALPTSSLVQLLS
ncbi:MAG: zf-HC2 domain-containing protein [Gemmatimonadota bacterium]|jgi:hypothetical protein